MRDFRIVQAKVALPIRTIVPVRSFLPVSILVSGDGLEQVTEILYNKVRASEFIVQQGGQVLFRVPEGMVGKPLNSLEFFSNQILPGKSQSLSLRVGAQKSVSGISRLVQQWVVVFLTTPGSDIFDPASGGGGGSLIGKPHNRDGSSVSADLLLAVNRANDEMRKSQSSRRVPPDERFSSADISDINFDPQAGELQAVLILKSMVGTSAQVQVT